MERISITISEEDLKALDSVVLTSGQRSKTIVEAIRNYIYVSGTAEARENAIALKIEELAKEEEEMLESRMKLKAKQEQIGRKIALIEKKVERVRAKKEALIAELQEIRESPQQDRERGIEELKELMRKRIREMSDEYPLLLSDAGVAYKSFRTHIERICKRENLLLPERKVIEIIKEVQAGIKQEQEEERKQREERRRKWREEQERRRKEKEMEE